MFVSVIYSDEIIVWLDYIWIIFMVLWSIYLYHELLIENNVKSVQQKGMPNDFDMKLRFAFRCGEQSGGFQLILYEILIFAERRHEQTFDGKWKKGFPFIFDLFRKKSDKYRYFLCLLNLFKLLTYDNVKFTFIFE